jgi:hypothetical protein
MPEKIPPDNGTTSSTLIHQPRLNAIAATEDDSAALRSGDKKPDFKYNRNTDRWEYKFYRQRDWNALYEEFCTARNRRGHLKYESSHGFVVAKVGKGTREYYLMLEMIGPKPQLRRGKLLRAPWLGNWEILRSDSYSSISNPQKLFLLRRAIKEREDKMQGVRATAPLLHDWIRTFHHLKEKVEAAYQGEPFSDRYRPDDPRNKNRFEMYLEMLKQVFEAEAGVL